MTNSRKEWYTIINPHAGSGKTMSKWVPAERHLKKLGVPLHIAYTTHKHHAEELAAAAARMGYRKILTVGGDGSIHEVFEGVLSWCEQSGTPPEEFFLALAPIGSGNDWIKAFKIPHDTIKMTEVLAQARFIKEDVVKVSLSSDKVSYMANIGGIVFDSHVCQQVNHSKEHGKRKARIYLRSLLHNLFHIKPINVDFYCDETLLYSGEVLDIAFGNGSYCGGGMQQCCLADPTDGILDAIIVPKVPILSLLPELPRIYRKNLDKSKKIIYARGKSFRIVPKDALSQDIVELDGEIVGRLPATVELLPYKINVLSNL